MTITRDQAQMLTTLAIACRPNGARRWDSAGVMAALRQLTDRSLPEVVMATIRAASDRDVDTPGVIPSPGSHWAAAEAVRTAVVDSAPPGSRCTVCGRTADRHGTADHDYRHPQPKADPEVVADRVAALKAELAPTSSPTQPRTLADLAEANPTLHARVDALRAANPGLAAPPMRETPDHDPADAEEAPSE